MSEVRPFRLSPSFLDKYSGQQPKWGPVGYITYKRTYARKKDDGSIEEFWETCKRVVEGVYFQQKKHCYRLGLVWDHGKAQRSAQEMFTRMWQFKWLPPGRGLWMMGTPYAEEHGGMSLNNCAFQSTESISIDFAEPFCSLMDMLMLGVGVGFDTRGAGSVVIAKPRVASEVTHVVDDSREGWVSLLRRYLNAYAGRGFLPGKVDYSRVRPEGSPINGFGGTASGPAPLKALIDAVEENLTPLIGEPITVAAIVDICNLIGKCVVAGNVRRSAEIAFGNPLDEDFLNLKNPEVAGDALMSHRWASNNSIFAEVGMDYSKIADLIAKNGEPGCLWLDNARNFSRMKDAPDYKDRKAAGANPCVEQTLEHSEICCLVETFPSLHDSYADYEQTLKYAYLYAKTVTLMSTHHERTNQVMLRNRRIGTSMSGIVQAIQKHGRREFFNWCDNGYTYLKQLDKQYSDWLCIRESIKISSVKPSGSVSLLPGVTPGIHFPHDQYYLRRIRFQKNHPLVASLQSAGYPVEDDKYSPNTVVVEFPVEEKFFDRSKTDVTMWEQLELAAQMQHYWADNQVSATITFNKPEAKDIKYALELYETRLKGISFLPLSEHGYVQAPYESITKEDYDARMSNIVASIEDAVDMAADLHDTDEKFCDGDSCEIPWSSPE